MTVETEANWDSKSTNEGGLSLVGSLDLSCQYKRFVSCLGCSSRPSTKYFFPHRTLFQFICPPQLCWVACLLAEEEEEEEYLFILKSPYSNIFTTA
jgi:hypothetical protein